MWYTILITLVVDVGGLLILYAVLRDRVRRATSAAAQIGELRDEVSRLVVELNQTTERNVALLEDRISGLSELLGAADRKMALLAREIEKHDVGAKVYGRLTPGQAAAGAPPYHEAAPRQPPPREPPLAVELSETARAGAPLEGRASGASAASTAPAAPAAPAAGRPAEQDAGAARQDVRERVIMLSRSGFSPSLIATRVGIPMGEVELIISLERQRSSRDVSHPGDELA